MESYDIYRVKFWSEPDRRYMQEYYRCPVDAAKRMVDLMNPLYMDGLYPKPRPTIETVIVY